MFSALYLPLCCVHTVVAMGMAADHYLVAVEEFLAGKGAEHSQHTQHSDQCNQLRVGRILRRKTQNNQWTEN
jgi:hypothetical protein